MSWFLALLVVGSGIAQGEQSSPLVPFPAVPTFKFDPNQDTSQPTCSEIKARLVRFHTLNQDAQFGVIEFLDVSAQRVGEWHSMLLPLEGKEKMIPQGTFGVLAEGSSAMGDLTTMAYQNLDYLERDLASIIDGLENCLLQNKNKE